MNICVKIKSSDTNLIMHLDKLEIKGFKSFKNNSVIEFPGQFTIIAGPNGSGKSNLTEALCFVLGKSRGLRASRLTELIYNGGVSDRASGSGRVSLYLSPKTESGESNFSGNSNNCENYKNNSTTKISRIIDASGKSEYYLNDKKCTRSRVLEIVGDNDYNIILQDDITKVIEMTHKERRTIIDDVCGISEYDKKKDAAIAELETVEKKIADTNLILGEKRAYLSDLKKERDDAIAYKQADEMLKKTKACMMHKKIKTVETKISNVADKILNLNKEKEKIYEKFSDIDSKINDKKKILRDINDEIFRLEDEKGAGRAFEIEGEIKIINHKISDLNLRLSDTKNYIYKKTDKKVSLSSELAGYEKEQKTLKTKIVTLAEKIGKEAKNISDMKLEEKIDKARSQEYELKLALNMIIGEKRAAETKVQQMLASKESVSQQLSDMLWDEKKLARRLDDFSMDNRQMFDDYDKLGKEILKIDGKIEKLNRELEKHRIDLASKNAEIKTYEAATGAAGSAVNEVFELKNSNIVLGIEGMVAQLGDVVSDEYELALDIAAGARMRFIVVKDDDVASRCISHLKRTQKGRATFLPLNKIKVIMKDWKRELENIKSNIEGSIADGVIGWAKDLINTESKFNKVFEFVFADTLVVENVGVARAVGIGRYRMVTLEGDLMDKSGTMTGGYIKPKGSGIGIGFMRTDSMAGDIDKIAGKIYKIEEEISSLKEQKVMISGRSSVIESSLKNKREDYEKMKIKKESLSEKREQLKEQADGIDAGISSNEKQISDIEKRIESARGDLERISSGLEKLMSKKESVNLATLEKLKDEKRELDVDFGETSARCKSLYTQVGEIEGEINDHIKQKAGIEEEIESYESKIPDLKEELKTAREENQELVERIENLIKERKTIEEGIEKLGESKGEFDINVRKIDDEINRAQIIRAKLETEAVDLNRDFGQMIGVDMEESTPGEREIFLDAETLARSIVQLEDDAAGITGKLNSLGDVNLRAITSYDIMKSEIVDVSGKLKILADERRSIYRFMDDIEIRKREVFNETYEIIKENFERIFREITFGEGTLILDNPRDISNSGLIIEASPAGKKIISLDAMSGGEKVLTSSAFLLALQKFKPSSFYVIDELDASLDNDNSVKLAKILKDSTSQFILISHKADVMKYADTLIGISMQDGISQVVGIDLKSGSGG